MSLQDQINLTPHNLTGRVIGHYRIEAVIETTSMGVVFRATDVTSPQRVAIKFIRRIEEHYHHQVKRFILEARALARLKHPNIVSLYDAGVEDGCHYIVTEYIEGKSFDQIIPDPKFPTNDKLLILAKVAIACDHAHKMGIVHRDLKPNNIIVDRRRNPYVCDFGLARFISQVTPDSIAAQGLVIGTPGYMAPEVVLGQSDDADLRSDVYSLGAILYEILCGQPPFARYAVNDVLELVVTQDPEPPSKIKPKVPTLLEHVAMKALSRDRRARYSSAESFANALLRVIEAGRRRPGSSTSLSSLIVDDSGLFRRIKPGAVKLEMEEARVLKDEADQLIERARRKARTGEDPVPELDQAIAGYTRALLVHPAYAEAFAGRAAARHYKAEALQARGENPEAELREGIKDAAAAVRAGLTTAALRVRKARLHYLLAEHQYRSGSDPRPELAEAEREYTEALRHDPNQSTWLHNRGVCRSFRARYLRRLELDYATELQAAVADFTAAVNLVNDYAAAYAARGISYHMLGRREDAVADLRKAINLEPSLRRRLSKTLKELGLADSP